MFAQTAEPSEKSSLAYENSYVNNEEVSDDVSDGINVTSEEEPVRNSDPVKKFQATVNVNFRLSPDIKRADNIIGTLKKDEIVTQLDDTFTDGFIHVEYEKKKGYIQQQYLKEV